MKVTVNKCPHTGRLIECDKAYAKHMREVRKQIADDAERFEFAKTFDQFVERMHRIKSFEGLEKWLSDNYFLYARHYGFRNRSWYSNASKAVIPGPDDKAIFEFRWKKYSEAIPTDTGSWGRTPRRMKAPYRASYGSYPEPGWEGSIGITFKGNAYEFFDSDQLKQLGIHTGSGGGGPKGLRYDFKMFAEDFRGIASGEVLKKLANVNA